MDKPTHSAGHILDLLITSGEEPLVFNISVCDPDLSAHFVVHCDILITKPSFERKEIEFRKLKTIDTKMISDELLNSSLLLHPPEDLHQFVSLYNSVLAAILNKHAPVRRRVIMPFTSSSSSFLPFIILSFPGGVYLSLYLGFFWSLMGSRLCFAYKWSAYPNRR